MSGIRQRTPWWCWVAVLTAGFFSFVGLLVAGFKLKNYLWLGLGFGHLVLVILFADAGGWIIWLSIGLIVYLFAVVRKQFWAHQLEMDSSRREAILHEKYQRQLEEEKIRLKYESQLSELKAESGVAQSWSCTGCGAENNNATGVCEYCGVAVKR